MIVKPLIFDNILFGELAPWIPENNAETKFRDILNNQVRTNKDIPEKFFKALITSLRNYSIVLKLEHLPNTEIIANLAKFAELQTDFNSLAIPTFYNKASEFYMYLIINERVRILAAITNNTKKCATPIDSEFQVVSLLNNLEYTINQVAQKSYTDKLSIYVLNALKISLFRIYEEIKSSFPYYIGSESLAATEIISILDTDFSSNKLIPDSFAYAISQFLSLKDKNQTNSKTTETDTKNKKSEIPDKPAFIPKKNDFRSGYKGKLTYDDVIKPELFSKLEEYLYNYDFIDLDYNFKDIHTKKKEFAAIYKLLIRKNYFREKNIKHLSKFRDAEYRQYLDIRYNVSTTQQFSKCTPSIVQSVSDKYYWLDTLQACK